MVAFNLTDFIHQIVSGLLGFNRFSVRSEPIRLSEKLYGYIVFQEAADLITVWMTIVESMHFAVLV